MPCLAETYGNTVHVDMLKFRCFEANIFANVPYCRSKIEPGDNGPIDLFCATIIPHNDFYPKYAPGVVENILAKLVIPSWCLVVAIFVHTE